MRNLTPSPPRRGEGRSGCRCCRDSRMLRSQGMAGPCSRRSRVRVAATSVRSASAAFGGCPLGTSCARSLGRGCKPIRDQLSTTGRCVLDSGMRYAVGKVRDEGRRQCDATAARGGAIGAREALEGTGRLVEGRRGHGVHGVLGMHGVMASPGETAKNLRASRDAKDSRASQQQYSHDSTLRKQENRTLTVYHAPARTGASARRKPLPTIR